MKEPAVSAGFLFLGTVPGIGPLKRTEFDETRKGSSSRSYPQLSATRPLLSSLQGTLSVPDRFQTSFNTALPTRQSEGKRVTVMLEWILILLIVAAVAGLFGMPRLAGVAASGAQLLIFVVLAILLVSLLFGVIAVA